MSDKERVWFMASGKICNLITAFFVVRIGLELFDEEDLKHFRIFLKVSHDAIITNVFAI
jgi:hypothetical protein